MSHFTSSELKCNLYFIAMLQKFASLICFCVQIIFINIRGQAKLFYFSNLLVLFRFFCLTQGLVTEFSVISYFTNGGFGGGSYFYSLRDLHGFSPLFPARTARPAGDIRQDYPLPFRLFEQKIAGEKTASLRSGCSFCERQGAGDG